MEELEHLFPVVNRHTWLNHAAISPWPRPVSEAMRAFVEDNARNGPLHYSRWMQTELRVRERAAALLQAEAEDIALLKNTSEGLCLIAGGLSWEDGDQLVCCHDDFPSNVLPWMQLVPQQVEKTVVTLDRDRPETALIDAIGPSTRLVAVSSVRYDCGLRLDLETISRACRKHGALLVVDAIQHLGALPFKLGSGMVDFVVSGSHKWLMAAEGLALFWSSADARARLKPVMTGWRMWPDMFNFARRDWRVPEDARRFEPGTLNMAGIHALDAALGLLLQFDEKDRAGALVQRSERLINGLSSIGDIELLTPAAPDRHAGIVSFHSPRMNPERMHHQLVEAGIYTAIRGTALRLSPHFYTPMEQLDRTLEIIARQLVNA